METSSALEYALTWGLYGLAVTILASQVVAIIIKKPPLQSRGQLLALLLDGFSAGVLVGFYTSPGGVLWPTVLAVIGAVLALPLILRGVMAVGLTNASSMKSAGLLAILFVVASFLLPLCALGVLIGTLL
jgi:hypothetical protein